MSLITVSQGLGSDGTAITRRVTAILKQELYDDSRLKAEALRMGLHADKLKGFDEKAPGFFDRLLGRKPEVYLDLMQAVVYEVARRGEGIIVGHGSQVLLREFDCALHVLISGSMPARIRNLMTRQGLSHDVAAKLIVKNDSEKQGFFQYAYHKDWKDPSLYDLCINPEKIGMEQAAELIAATARSPELKACSLKALDAMETLSQAKKVEAALAENDMDSSLLNVDVPQKGVAHIRGVVSTREEQDQIKAIVASVPGIQEVRLEVSVMSRAFA
jgi:cytidylate kinase